jgi:hypothetical protein
MSLFDLLFGGRQSRNEPNEIERTEVDHEEVEDAINDFFDEHDTEEDNIYSLDSDYYACSEEDMRSVVERDDTETHEFIEEKYDCENFALSFMAGAQKEYGVTTLGLVIDWSGTHAYNILVTDELEILLMDPQSDTFVEPGEEDKYAFTDVRIVI